MKFHAGRCPMEGGSTYRIRKVTVGVIVHDLIARGWLRGAGWWHLRPKCLNIYHQRTLMVKIWGEGLELNSKSPINYICHSNKEQFAPLDFFSSEIWCLSMSPSILGGIIRPHRCVPWSPWVIYGEDHCHQPQKIFEFRSHCIWCPQALKYLVLKLRLRCPWHQCCQGWKNPWKCKSNL